MGLLCAQKDIRPNDILFMEDELEEFKGGLTENYVYTQLTAGGFKPFFWRTDKGTYEVDFIITADEKLIPVEVKSSSNTTSDSLKEYIKRYQPVRAIRISEKNFGLDGGIQAVPLYAAFCIGT